MAEEIHHRAPAVAHLLSGSPFTGQCLFVIHVRGFDPELYRIFASGIRDGLSVYSVRLDNLHSFRTIEGIASWLIETIVSTQPSGPYRVAGWSTCGVLAFEVATQLLGMDQEVRFLGLFDPVCCNQPQLSLNLPYSAYEKDSRWDSVPSERLEETNQLVRSYPLRRLELEDLIRTYQSLGLIFEPSAQTRVTELKEWLRQETSAAQIAAQYFPQRLSIPVYLFTSTPTPSPDSRHEVWKRNVPEHLLRVVSIACIRDPRISNVCFKSLGQIVSQALNEVDQEVIRRPEIEYISLVTLRDDRVAHEGSIFCVPGAGDSVTSYIEVVSNMKEDIHVYGLQPRGMDGTQIPHASVRAAALCYLKQICQARPNGPVYLLGHSFGGWVAFEIACLLVERGCPVESLILLDSSPPDGQADHPREFDRSEAIMEMVAVLERLLGRPLLLARQDFDSRGESDQLRLLHGRLISAGLVPHRSEPQLLYGPLRTFCAALRLGYKPSTSYMGKVRLLLADDDRVSEESNRNQHFHVVQRWKKWAPCLSHARAPGNHMTMLRKPNARSLLSLFEIKKVPKVLSMSSPTNAHEQETLLKVKSGIC